MWGRQKQRASVHTTLIASGTEICGDIRFSGHLEIEGIVRGNIGVVSDQGEAFVRVLQSGRIEGEVRVPEVVINGRVSGDVYASGHVELAEQAIVDGDVHYHLIEMIKGAQVNGNLVHIAAPEVALLVAKPKSDADEEQDSDGDDPIRVNS